jgi:alpha-tubulin suppressor-like RCC1 family protein
VPDDLDRIIAVSSGLRFTAAVTELGSVFCWGDNTSGKCDAPEDLSTRDGRCTDCIRKNSLLGSECSWSVRYAC